MCRQRNLRNYKHIKLRKIIMRHSIIKLFITIAKQKSSEKNGLLYTKKQYKY